MPCRNNSKRKPWLSGLGTSFKAADWELGPHGGGEGQRQSSGLDIGLGCLDLGPLENLECQEVVFSGALEFMHLGA